MSVEEVRSVSPKQGYDIIVRNVSTDEDYQYLLSSPGRRSPQRLDLVSQDILDVTDDVSSLLDRSPGRKLLVISPRSVPRSPDQMQSFDFDNPLSALGGQQIIMLGHHSKVSLAEQAVITKIRTKVLLSCFQFMKALKHWKHKLVSKVFTRMRKWAVASQYLRISEHKAHQKEVLEQRMNLKVLVAHHTASSRARTEKNDNTKPATKAPLVKANKPGFRPSSTNPVLQIQTKFPTTPIANKKGVGSPKKVSPTRQATVQYLNNKYFQPTSTTKTVRTTGEGKSRSTTPTPLVTNVSSLASHRFYHQSRPQDTSADSIAAVNTSNSSPVGAVAEPGFDHKPLASATLSSSPDLAVLALRSRVFSSPDRSISALRGRAIDSPGGHSVASANTTTAESVLLTTPELQRQPLVTRSKSLLQAFQDSRKPSPASALSMTSQRAPVLRPHLNGTLTAAQMQGPTTPLTKASQMSSEVSPSFSISPGSLKESTPPGHSSPSVAEMAYARSRGSRDTLYTPYNPLHTSLEMSVLSGSSFKENFTSGMREPASASEARVKPTTVVLPVLPRLGKLQAVLSQHRSRPLPSRPLPSRALPVREWENESVNSTEVDDGVRSEGDVAGRKTAEVEIKGGEEDHSSTSHHSEEFTKQEEVIAEEEKDAEQKRETDERDEAELELIVLSAEEGTSAEEIPSTKSSTSTTIEHSTHYKHLAFRKVQRKIYDIQDRQTRHLRAVLPAMEFHINVRLHRAFRTLFTHNVQARTMQCRAQAYHAHARLGKAFQRLRTQYLEAKISRYRSYDSAINIDNFALTKAFWRLRRNVTHRHQSWFVEQRGVKYHRFLRLSQALSSFMQFGAYGNVVFEGDAGSVHDVGGEEDNEESEVFKTAALLVQRLGASDGDFNFDTTDSDEEVDRKEGNYLPEGFEELSSEHDDGQDSVQGDHYLSPQKVSVDEAEVQKLTRWEDQLEADGDGDTHSESSAEHEAFEIGAISALGLRSSDNSPTPRSPRTIDLSHFVHAPHGPAHGLLHTYPAYEPTHPHHVEAIRHQISRSRSDDFPGVSGIDMWDWQDLHSVSREFISDSECDSSREAIEDAVARSRLTPPLPSAVLVKVPRGASPLSIPVATSPLPGQASASSPATPLLGAQKLMRRMSSRSLSISPIYSADTSLLPEHPPPNVTSVVPAWRNQANWHEEETETDERPPGKDKQQREDDAARNAVREHDENSDISLFLSDDSDEDEENHHDELKNWPSPPQSKNTHNNRVFSSPAGDHMQLEESAIVYQASPSPLPNKNPRSVVPHNPSGRSPEAAVEVVELDLPPLPSSPCPSDDERDIQEEEGGSGEGEESEEETEENMDDPPPPHGAHLALTDYISHSDSDADSLASVDSFGEKKKAHGAQRVSVHTEMMSPSRKIVDFGASLQQSRAYWRRTKLSQGMYALNQWVVRNQTLLTMNDILFEFQALRKLRRGLKTLRNMAML